MNNTNNNISNIKSSVININIMNDELNDIVCQFIKDNNNLRVLEHKDYEVLIGYVDQGEIKFYNNTGLEIKYLQELRIFNELSELHIIKEGNRFIGRERIDNEGAKAVIYDEVHAVFGTRINKYNENWSELIEDRGTRIIIPFKIDNNTKISPKLFYKVRNYIDDKDGYIKFKDARLIDFLDENYEKVEVI